MTISFCHVLLECSKECRGRVYYVTPRLLGSDNARVSSSLLELITLLESGTNFNLSSLQTSSYLSAANKGERVISPPRRGQDSSWRFISHRRRNFVRNTSCKARPRKTFGILSCPSLPGQSATNPWTWLPLWSWSSLLSSHGRALTYASSTCRGKASRSCSRRHATSACVVRKYG